MFQSLKRKRSIKRLTEKGETTVKRFHHSVSELEGEVYLVASGPFSITHWNTHHPSESCNIITFTAPECFGSKGLLLDYSFTETTHQTTTQNGPKLLHQIVKPNLST